MNLISIVVLMSVLFSPSLSALCKIIQEGQGIDAVIPDIQQKAKEELAARSKNPSEPKALRHFDTSIKLVCSPIAIERVHENFVRGEALLGRGAYGWVLNLTYQSNSYALKWIDLYEEQIATITKTLVDINNYQAKKAAEEKARKEIELAKNQIDVKMENENEGKEEKANEAKMENEINIPIEV